MDKKDKAEYLSRYRDRLAIMRENTKKLKRKLERSKGGWERKIKYAKPTQEPSIFGGSFLDSWNSSLPKKRRRY